MRVYIENEFVLRVESDDKSLLGAVQAQTDGEKVRNQNQILIPIKSGPKLFNFSQYGLEFVDGAEEAVYTVKYNHDKRKENIKKIRSQYGHEIKFEYDIQGMYPAMEHQKIMFNMMAYNSAAAILAEPGTCKTGPYLWAIDHRIKKGQVKKALVVTLSSLKKNVIEEMRIQAPSLKGVILDKKDQSDKILNKGFSNAKKNLDYDVYVSNYESIHSLSDLFCDSYFDMVVLDEAHRIGTYQSRQTKSVIDKFENSKYKYIITGTLNANSSLSFFSPFRFLGPDCIPYANFYEFRRKYFYPVDPNQYIWKEGTGTRHEVKEIIGEMSVFFEKEECVDLPPITYSKYSCAMDVEQQKYYDDIKHQFFTKIDNMCELCNKKGKCLSLCDKTVSIKNAISAITKLQQVACGFYMNRVTNVSDDGKETIDKNIITFKSNPKLRLLIETLNNIPHNRKVIIWSNLIHSIDLIDEAIKKSGLGQSLLIYQNIDAFDQVEEFKDPKYRYLIANPSKAGAGLNIQFDNSNYQVFYSCNYSYIMRTQAEGRQHRKGQKNIVTVIDLYCKDSIDETILQALAEKEELSETLVSAAKLTQILKGNKLIKA